MTCVVIIIIIIIIIIIYLFFALSQLQGVEGGWPGGGNPTMNTPRLRRGGG